MEEKTVTDEVFLNPRTDFGFKKIFMDKKLLIDFLNGIIGGKARITNVNYLPNTVLGEWDTDRKAVFDLYCMNSNNEYFIVEMQQCRQTYFIDRSLFYTSAAIRDQAPVGKWDYRLKAVYLIAILDFVEFREAEVKDTYIEQIYLYRKNARKQLNDRLNMLFIELPKFTKTAGELNTNVERWIYLLKNLEKLKDRPPEVQGRIFERLFKRAQVNRLTNKEMEEYRTSIFEYDSIKNAIAYSELIGMEKARMEMARECLREGLPVKVISAITKLSIEQIKNISEC